MEKIKILFAGGGTGGHLFTGLALADAYVCLSGQSKDQILFVGTEQGLEKEIVPQNGYPLEFVPVQKLKGQGLKLRLKTLMALPKAFLKARALLKKEKPQLVIGIGGYASGPTTLMAKWMGIKTAIIEQNAMPGLSNRILGRFVDRVFVAFKRAENYFKKSKTLCLGNPVRSNIQPTPLSFENPCLLILGGSQGSRAISQTVFRISQKLLVEFSHLKIIHQCGKIDYLELKKKYEELQSPVDLRSFIENMQEAYNKATLIVARSGAGTVTEIISAGRAALFIPYPFAADDHQRYNAMELVNVGAAKIIPQLQLTDDLLYQEIASLLKNPKEIENMAEQSAKLASPQCKEAILEECLKLVLGEKI